VLTATPNVGHSPRTGYLFLGPGIDYDLAHHWATGEYHREIPAQTVTAATWKHQGFKRGIPSQPYILLEADRAFPACICNLNHEPLTTVGRCGVLVTVSATRLSFK
jgi:hypothetical protein